MAKAKKKVKKKPLSDKQLRFVKEYMIDLNATAAAERAGYAKRSAKLTGHNLTKHPQVKRLIGQEKLKREKRTELSADIVIEELRRVGFAKLSDFVEWGPDGVIFKPSANLTAAQVAAVEQVTEKITENAQGGGSTHRSIKLHDKLGALDKLCKHLGIYADQEQQGVVINIHRHTHGKDDE